MGIFASRHWMPRSVASRSLNPTRASSGSVNRQNGTCRPVVVRFPPEEVRANDAEVVFADVREVRPAGAVAAGPNAFCRRLKPLVRFDVPARVGFHAGQFQTDTVGVRCPAAGHKQVRAGDYTLAVWSRTDSPDRPSTRCTGLPFNTSIPSSWKSCSMASVTSESSR